MFEENKILVTGANGQLGTDLKDALPGQIFIGKSDLDIRDSSQIEKTLEKYNPQVVVNCAAFTNVDGAETNQEMAFAVNAHGVQKLSEVTSKNSIKLIHISTDYVFDGKKNAPYKEDDPTNPLNVYGKSKRQGEELISKDAIVLRTSWLHSHHSKNFVKTILRLLKEKDELKVVSDQMGRPTYCPDLAVAITKVIEKNIPGGLYHYSNIGEASWYDFAKKIGECAGLSTPVYPIPTSQFPTPAPRPPYSILDLSKYIESVEVPPHWEDSLKTCVQRVIQSKD